MIFLQKITTNFEESKSPAIFITIIKNSQCTAAWIIH
jgi:hypothetical protein